MKSFYSTKQTSASGHITVQVGISAPANGLRLNDEPKKNIDGKTMTEIFDMFFGDPKANKRR